MTYDITETLAPASDQLDACDLREPTVFTITSVSKGNPEQPVQVHLAEFPRVWRPGKSMRRVLAACWSTDASTWVGRRVELYCDETVVFGKDAVGGTRISRLSHIDGPRKVPLLVSRGKSAMFTVQPLADDEPVQSSNITAAQGKKIGALFAGLGITDHAERLAEVCARIGREVASAGELTGVEADGLIGWLETRTQPEADA